MERTLSLTDLKDIAHEESQELISSMNRLYHWIGDAHQPSRGAYLEMLVRDYLKRKLPTKFEVSTGFIAGTERTTEGDLKRITSSQLDILVWDALNYPPLFKKGELVVIAPQSCLAIIEVTNTVTSSKLREDLEKIDTCIKYHYNRPLFDPVICHFSFRSSKSHNIKKLTHDLDHALHFNRTVPLDVRYSHFRNERKKGSFQYKYGPTAFPHLICNLDMGFIYSATITDDIKNYVAYIACPNTDKNHSLSGFERSLIAHILTKANRNFELYELDLFREIHQTRSINQAYGLPILDFKEDQHAFPELDQSAVQIGLTPIERLPFNKLNRQNNKSGFWIETMAPGKHDYGKYLNGVKSGVWTSYTSTTDGWELANQAFKPKKSQKHHDESG